MSNWNIEDPIDKSDKYEWRLPNNEDQHIEQTVAPGDLMIKPEDVDLIVTLAPKKSGIQHGQVDWSYDNILDSSWYIYGFVEED